MTDPTRQPVPIDLTAHGHLVEGSREFLRLWARDNGPITCFVNPRPLGPDPYLLGVALAEAVEHGARAYARAIGVSEAEAATRIWQGVDANRELDLATALPQQPDAEDDFLTYTAPKDR